MDTAGGKGFYIKLFGKTRPPEYYMHVKLVHLPTFM